MCCCAMCSGFRAGDNPVDGVSKVLPKHKTDQHHFAALPYTETPAFVVALRGANTHREPSQAQFEKITSYYPYVTFLSLTVLV